MKSLECHLKNKDESLYALRCVKCNRSHIVEKITRTYQLTKWMSQSGGFLLEFFAWIHLHHFRPINIFHHLSIVAHFSLYFASTISIIETMTLFSYGRLFSVGWHLLKIFTIHALQIPTTTHKIETEKTTEKKNNNNNNYDIGRCRYFHDFNDHSQQERPKKITDNKKTSEQIYTPNMEEKTPVRKAD